MDASSSEMWAFRLSGKMWGSLAEHREAEAGCGLGCVKAKVTFTLVVNGGQCV